MHTMKTIAVIFGGQSTEHDVSIVTALSSIIKPLQLTKQYEVVPIYIAKDGSWYWDEKLNDIQLFQSGDINTFMQKAPKVHLLFDDGLTIVKSSQFAGRKQYKKIDIVFPAMHGTHGEDGDLMGLLEMAGVAYVGCGVSASAIAMDKVLCKLIVEAYQIPTPKMQFISSSDLERSPTSFVTAVNQQLTYPLFVKPAHLGSSIGITRVTDKSGLMNALEVAAHYDDKVIVEEAVQNLVEVTLPIMGNDDPIPAFLEQPLLKTEDFFDFETKYMQGGKGGKKGGKAGGAQGYSTIPAALPEDIYAKAVTTGLAVYKAIGCTGTARVDMLIDSATGVVYFNEVNPLPGGLYAHNWQQKGVSKVQLVTDLVQYALERHAKRSKLHTTFTTNYLKQF
jgi:D-alanine-D-alanine ligase